MSGTLGAAIYSSKSRFASPKLDSRVVIGGSDGTPPKILRGSDVLLVAQHDIRQ